MKPVLFVTGVLAGCIALAGCQQPQGAQGRVDAAFNQTRWETPYGSGLELQTANYRIYTTATSASLRVALPGFMETAYRNYLQLTGLQDLGTHDPMALYVMGTRPEWAILTQHIVGEQQAPKYLALENGGYCYQGVCVLWQIGGPGTLSIASHEGLHQFFHHRMKNRLPMWAEEGLCTLAEGYDIDGPTVQFTPGRNPSRYSDLQGAISRQYWIPLKDLLPMDAGDAISPDNQRTVGYYGQLWSLQLFIRSDPVYRAGLVRMLNDAQAGTFDKALHLPAAALAELQTRGRIYNQTVSENLFRHYICPDLAAFQARYKTFATDLVELQ